ncbi:acetyl-CoA C-acyltransferase [Rhodobacterales bacterium HKCCE3408]|nr:acetyl-CoA C-acyltransferase [Rhodobacterales bacterium HKCCE3408]
MQEAVILSGTRTAVGRYGGSLKDTAPETLGGLVIAEAIRRAGVEAGAVQAAVMGNVIRTRAEDAYLARMCAMAGGMPKEAHAVTVNRLCGSGLEAIVNATQQIQTGETDLAVAGGVESMSRATHSSNVPRFGARMGPITLEDDMLAALHDPFGAGHMGVTAENLAEKFQITREKQDAFAAESHRRAAAAIAEGRFRDQILPVELKSRKGTITFDTDEHVRSDVTAENLAELRPAFKKENGTVTAGNASGINDGAAAVVVASSDWAEAQGRTPLARIVSYARAGVEPSIMGIGPVPAVRRALDRAGLSVDDIDVIESNEAFAAQACAVAQELGFPAEKTNINGGAVALGHPVGATGAIITVKCLYELQRIGGRYGLMTLCIGGGQGIAMVIERL